MILVQLLPLYDRVCISVCICTYIVDTLDLCSDLKNAEAAACCVAAALTTSSVNKM